MLNYCGADHQSKHRKNHKKLCNIISKDPQGYVYMYIKAFNSASDSMTDAEITVRKSHQPLGLLLQLLMRKIKDIYQ